MAETAPVAGWEEAENEGMEVDGKFRRINWNKLAFYTMVL